MLHRHAMKPLIFISLISFVLSSCYKYHPPYNNFKPYRRTYVTTPPGALAGTAAMAAAGGPVIAGTAIGAAMGAGVGGYKDSKRSLIRQIQQHEIQYIQYGDTVTFVVPTDRYFMFNSPRLNELCFPGLALLIKLLKTFPPCCPIYVAGFTNDVGSRYHKNKLTQAQAEAMLTFLWANDIPAQRLSAEGYGDKHPVSDNRLVHGSAQNRRLEIQVFYSCATQAPQPAPYVGYIK
ncbi:C-OmpA-like family protein CmpA [Legionella hackeliae]|uniref:Putative lipoprotein n=1 Tax=Legionella hackeliae TaxID=449 RepID=A0A0A8UYE3_LEGHA|nr:C-OmpA-like family protein CmpA [Legionella hackeliae]KTD09908.1 outer membrane protein, OmpA family protein [Legionella hackeliae]CEK11789.1 putative lipoprotein [Legionella hackeliae]STX48560.1 outer membrane protein, OmpA family protein [Legionella hackeliae]